TARPGPDRVHRKEDLPAERVLGHEESAPLRKVLQARDFNPETPGEPFDGTVQTIRRTGRERGRGARSGGRGGVEATHVNDRGASCRTGTGRHPSSDTHPRGPSDTFRHPSSGSPLPPSGRGRRPRHACAWVSYGA